ncbi:pilus assembly protein [Streptomyces scopuliridis]|uniref:Pilus assembly protein n=1 Tax=Streptomyces scopuliridis TaxID=452529 RepID=A0ACD4ZI63_9ACTN|nr:TadE/TadG family type IV pilus assembly protein [Streptomyces scopuliridis]WSB33717.1 pilus assembly protein [Streptomyces scopuliridis]WSB97990.1 pilus assembly protein [Streptomyces scopuliridis]WSC08308.1 pilus assembly protein [Streptomyces scopuliridis]
MAKRTARDARERGQIALEYVGVVTILLFLALAAIQLGLAAYAVQQASTAARAAARAATYNEATMNYQEAGKASMSNWLAKKTDISKQSSGDQIEVTVKVKIPPILPIFDNLGEARRSATMPLD